MTSARKLIKWKGGKLIKSFPRDCYLIPRDSELSAVQLLTKSNEKSYANILLVILTIHFSQYTTAMYTYVKIKS